MSRNYEARNICRHWYYNHISGVQEFYCPVFAVRNVPRQQNTSFCAKQILFILQICCTCTYKFLCMVHRFNFVSNSTHTKATDLLLDFCLESAGGHFTRPPNYIIRVPGAKKRKDIANRFSCLLIGYWPHLLRQFLLTALNKHLQDRNTPSR